jgi:hypothetical protein
VTYCKSSFQTKNTTLAGLNIKIPRDESWVIILRREEDNLLDKIKGKAFWLKTKYSIKEDILPTKVPNNSL